METVSHDPPGCRALPGSSVIHCDRSSSSAPSDLTVVLRPHPPLSTVLSGGGSCHAYFIDEQQQRCSRSIQPQAIGMELSLVECLTLIHTQHTYTHKTLLDSCVNQGNPNKHALSLSGCIHPATRPGVLLLHVIEPQLIYHHINNN